MLRIKIVVIGFLLIFLAGCGASRVYMLDEERPCLNGSFGCNYGF